MILVLEISTGPVCPFCALDTFDDWWHDRTMKAGFGLSAVEGRLKCHGCGKFFKVRKDHDGCVTSSAHKRRQHTPLPPQENKG